ncbi:MAG: hypothetical protein U0531_10315 [Dehalococcoidia bacterium]
MPWEGAKQGYLSEITKTGPGERRIHLVKSATALDQKRILVEIGRACGGIDGRVTASRGHEPSLVVAPAIRD